MVLLIPSAEPEIKKGQEIKGLDKVRSFLAAAMTEIKILREKLRGKDKPGEDILTTSDYDTKVDEIDELVKQGYKNVFFGNYKPEEYFDEKGNLKDGFAMVEFILGNDIFRKIFKEPEKENIKQ